MSDISCMSYNILACDTHNSGYELPACRYPYVLETIKEQNPDLIGVQEACDLSCQPETREQRCHDFNWREQMIAGVSALGYTAVSIQGQEGFLREKQGIVCGLIIFFKSDRFEMIDNACQRFDHDITRYYQWVKLHDQKTDRNILFTNTHFSINPSICGSKNQMAGNAYRVTEAAKLLKFWYKNCPDDWALFATGDYNSTLDSDPQTMLGSWDFKPSYKVAEIPDDSATMNFATTRYCLDYCYVNPKAQKVTEFKVVKRSFPSDSPAKLAGFSSDHCPIMTFCDYIDPPTKE